MAPVVLTYHSVPDELFGPLKAHLPFSLPLLRRLQYTSFPGGLSEDSKIVLVHDSSEADNGIGALTKFTAAYVNVGGGPDTQMWLYSTLEDHEQLDDAEISFYDEQLESLIQETMRLARAIGRPMVYPEGVLLGSLSASTRSLLEKTGRVHPRESPVYDKWLFRVEEVPGNEATLPDGTYWDAANEHDCEVVISRTDIPRTKTGLLSMPSVVLKKDDGTPISWAFLSGDGSLSSLYCEPECRRRGLATLVAGKLFRERSGDFGDDGWCSADVAPDNDGSRGMCLRLNGKIYWQASWVILDLRETM